MAKETVPMIQVHNVETNEVEEIPMSNEDIARLKQLSDSLEKAKLEAEQAKQSAFDKLTALGLTEAEIKALAG